MRRILTFSLVISALLCFDVFADQVTLKNGDRLSGTIVKSDGETLSLKSEFAGEVKIQWAAIEKLSTDRPLYVLLKDGQIIFGTVTTTTSRIEVQTKEAGIVATTKEAIQSGEVILGEELNYKLSSSTSLAQRAVLYPNLSDIGKFRFSFDTTAVTTLRKTLGWQITLSDRYTSNPIPGIKKNDLLLTTGLRVTFGAGKK